MKTISTSPAAIIQPTSGELVLSGCWTALGIGALDRQLKRITVLSGIEIVVDGVDIEQLDTAGVWVLQTLMQRLRDEGHAIELRGWSPKLHKFFEHVSQQRVGLPQAPTRYGIVERIGRATVDAGEQALALLAFIGESAVVFAGSIAHPSRIRWRPILHNIGSAGFDALPIVGLLSFLMGIVIAYQAADQLRQYGANIFVVDLVGLSMLREFAPLMTAIIVAGRSGSAFAAQIGTMSVSEEIDAMRTIGIVPIELLVLPKIIALIIVLPLLTFFADVMGVLGGMLMAHVQLGIGYGEFFDRIIKAVSLNAYMIGIGKAPAFAAIIAVISCYQGFRTSGNADSVGRQTTRSVVDSIFLVIVTDALFSIFFSFLHL